MIFFDSRMALRLSGLRAHAKARRGKAPDLPPFQRGCRRSRRGFARVPAEGGRGFVLKKIHRKERIERIERKKEFSREGAKPRRNETPLSRKRERGGGEGVGARFIAPCLFSRGDAEKKSRHSARREAASQNPENPIPIPTFPLKGKELSFLRASAQKQKGRV